MIGGIGFDIYAGQFSSTELAVLCGVKRPVVDTMGTRGFIGPTRREQSAGPRQQSKAKGSRPKSPKGRPLFSFRDAVMVRMMRVLSPLGVGLSVSSFMADQAKERKITESEAAMDSMAELADVADTPATKGEWMWAMARSIERGKPFYIYAYATRFDDEWQFDMHIENPGVEKPDEPPCFGWNVPHIYVPVGEIFIAVYNDCKKLLGITMESASSKGV